MNDEEPIRINGKKYPLWTKFVRRSDEWKGGVLEDLDDDPMVHRAGTDHPSTIIERIELRPNGDDSAFFEIVGKDFGCGGDVQFVGVDPRRTNETWICFVGYGGQAFRIRKPVEEARSE